jgi:hypothetical protein
MFYREGAQGYDIVNPPAGKLAEPIETSVK